MSIARCLARPASLAVLVLAMFAGNSVAQSWTADLSAANQIPPLTEEEATAVTGTFTMKYEDGMFYWTLDAEGLTDFLMAHIHIGNASESGNVAAFLVPVGETIGADGALPVLDPPVSGNFSASSMFSASDLNDISLEDFIAAADSAGLYVNLHTVAFQGGVARGQVMPAPGWMADLTPESQVPALTSADVGGAMGMFSLTDMGDGMYSYTLEVMDITEMTAAHLHIGNATTSGGVALTLVPTDGSAGLENPFSGLGKFTGMFTVGDMVGELTGEQFVEMLTTDSANSFYVNVHTVAHPGGAIRGQLMSLAEDVVEPPTMAPTMAPPMEMTPPTGAATARAAGSLAALAAAALAALLL